MNQTISKIVWAIDALQERDKIWRLSTHALGALTQGSEILVKPVYVLSGSEMNVPGKIMTVPFESLLVEAEDRVNKKLKGLEVFVLNLLKPEIIANPVYSARGAATALYEYADAFQADLILVGTQGRKGISRLVLGSFAEALLLESKIPLLIVGESCHSIEKFDHILFPCDFSKDSDLIFSRVSSLAKQINAGITIAHVLQTSTKIGSDARNGRRWSHLQQNYGPYHETEKEKCRSLAEQYADKAREQGIHVNLVLQTSTSPVSQVILKLSKVLNASMIAMAAQSGAISSTLSGSTTRQVVRSATCPVWTLHERSLRKNEKQFVA